MANQSVFLRFPNQSLMYKLRQLHLGKFGKSPRECRFVGQALASLPAANEPQLLIACQPVQQISGLGKVIDRFGYKCRCDGIAILCRSSVPAATRRDESFQRDHLQRGDQTFGGIAQRSRLCFQQTKQFALQKMLEVAQLLTQSGPHMTLFQNRFDSASRLLFNAGNNNCSPAFFLASTATFCKRLM